jgi:LacI family transcriptional regulator
VVQFDKVSDLLASPKVITDDFQGAYAAVAHLIGKGYRKIAHISGLPHVKNSAERLRGYKKALADYRIMGESDWEVYCKVISEQEGFDFAKQLCILPNPPDAIFCITDLVTMGAMKFFK